MPIAHKIKSIIESPLALLATAIVLGPILALAIWLVWTKVMPVHTANVLRCYATGIPPEVVIAKGPISIDQNWKEFDVPVGTGIYRIPSVEHFGIKVLQADNHWEWDLNRDIMPNNGAQILTNLADGKEYYFAVKAIDDQNREVMLHSGIFNAPGFKNPPYFEPGFSLVDWRWEKAFYAPGTVIKKIAVRSTHPVSVHEINWSPMDLCRWPERTWRNIKKEELYRFEEPSMVTDELVTWEKYHPPGTSRHYFD